MTEQELANIADGMLKAQRHYEGDYFKEKAMEHQIKREEKAMYDNWKPVECKDNNNSYGSKGMTGTALGLGIAGTFGLLQQLGCGNGLLGGLGANGQCVNQKELAFSIDLAKKDSEIALLKAGLETNQKIIETTKYIDSKVERLEDRFLKFRDEQIAVNSQFNTLTATMTANLACQQNQLNQLMGLTKLVVPNTSVCPGWGQVCVSAIPCPGPEPAAKAR